MKDFYNEIYNEINKNYVEIKKSTKEEIYEYIDDVFDRFKNLTNNLLVNNKSNIEKLNPTINNIENRLKLLLNHLI